MTVLFVILLCAVLIISGIAVAVIGIVLATQGRKVAGYSLLAVGITISLLFVAAAVWACVEQLKADKAIIRPGYKPRDFQDWIRDK